MDWREYEGVEMQPVGKVAPQRYPWSLCVSGFGCGSVGEYGFVSGCEHWQG